MKSNTNFKERVHQMKKTHERLTYKQNEIIKQDKAVRAYAHKHYSYKDALEFIRIATRKAE
jgi:hypothetical protein